MARKISLDDATFFGVFKCIILQPFDILSFCEYVKHAILKRLDTKIIASIRVSLISHSATKFP